MPRRLLRAAAAGALLLGLAACNGPGGGAATTPPPEIDISAPSDGGGDGPSDGGGDPSDGGGENTEDPTAAAPDIPPPDPADFAGMDEQTPEGAEQAFRYYMAVSVWAHQTGDEQLVASLSNETCEGCTKFNSEISELTDRDLLWSESERSDVHLSIENSSNFEHEIRYMFTLGHHSRPDNELSSRVTVEQLQFDTVGGMLWDSDRWIVGGLSVEWGSDVH
ncbi:DUF6318 family protein [Brachybacterium sp. AOP43-C2-M15]|uniref:DUF6318 family protein n=1 Tax=Brachybacterium sp. AOP43-C2-M15 TaxID=3457661 RepID=UPI0040342CAE